MRYPFVTIAGRNVGINYPPYIVAELSANHLGDYNRALKIIEAAAQAGVDAVKLQTFTADTLSLDVKNEEFLLDKRGPWAGMTQYELYKEASTPWEWHEGLFKKAKELGLTVFSSPFDETSVDFLEKLQAPAYKIASYELVHLPLIAKVARTKKPLIFSTGCSSLDEVEDAVDIAQKEGAKEIILLHTIGGYPTPIKDAYLVNLRLLAKKYPSLVLGISDHSPGAIVPILSVGLGASFVEKHLTLSREDGGLDAAFSLEPKEMEEVVQSTKLAWSAMGIEKENEWFRPSCEDPNKISKRSIYVASDIKAGEEITDKNIKIIRPHYGLKPKFYFEVIGRKVKIDLKKGTPLSWDVLKEG